MARPLAVEALAKSCVAVSRAWARLCRSARAWVSSLGIDSRNSRGSALRRLWFVTTDPATWELGMESWEPFFSRRQIERIPIESTIPSILPDLGVPIVQ